MKFAGCALFSSVSNRARSSIWFLPFGSSHSAPSPNRHPFDSNRLWRGRDRFLAIGGPMNEDLMNRVISQVRIGVMLHCDQHLRECLRSGRNFVSKDGKSGERKTRGRRMIELYTWSTPNGQKASIMLEEVGLPYRVHPIDIGKDHQFHSDFLAISPNNKIPAIVDTDNGLSLMESGAILLYLAESTGKLWPQDFPTNGAW